MGDTFAAVLYALKDAYGAWKCTDLS